MLLFHEGLPRSGKSYEAMVRHIIPSLQSGRKVFAYIEGINHERVAEAAEMPLEMVRELLIQITREKVLDVSAVVEDNSFVVLDEAQNFWPTGRQKLPPAMMQFISEHGHRGLDVLLMGQDIRDVHPIWRRRVSQKVVFHKLDTLGQANRYNVTVYKATSPEKFEKVSAQLGSYDSKYFGTYSSHVDSSISTANYVDKRASIRNTFFVRWGLPLAGAAFVFGAITIYKYFHGSAAPARPVSAQSAAPPPTVQIAPAVVVASRGRKPFVEDLNDKYRSRLGVTYERAGRVVGWIEWWDGEVLRERLSFAQISEMGTVVEVRSGMAKVGGVWATPWAPRVGVRPADAGAVGAPAVGILSPLLGRS